MTSPRSALAAAEAAAAKIEPTDAERHRLTDLALRAQREEREVIDATGRLRAALDAYRRTTEVELPDAMSETGQSEFRLLDGTPVERRSTLVAGQLDDYRENANPEGLAYVESHGGASLVRATITREFDAEDLESAREVLEMIRRHPSANRMKTLTLQRMVPAPTIKKWVGELIAALRDPPLELLRVTTRTWTQVGGRRPKSVDIKGFVER